MAEPENAVPVSLWRNTSFKILWGGQFAAQLGPGVGAVVYPIVLMDEGATPALVGTMTFALGVAAVAARLPSGALADRFDRRAVMFWAQGARALGMGVLCLGLFTDSTWLLWLVMGVALVDVLGNEAYRFAERAALRHIVHPSQLSKAVGQHEARNQIVSMLGPIVGGWAMVLSRALPIGMVALGQAGAAIGLMFVKERLQNAPVRENPPAGPRTRVWTEAFSWIRASPAVRVLLISCLVPNLVISGVMLTVVMAGGEAGVGTGQIGTVFGVAAMGGIAGALCASALLRRLSPRVILLAVLWLLPPAVLATGVLIDHWTVVFPLAAAMAMAPLLSIILATYQLLTTPDHLQARVGSACTFITGSAAPLGPLVAGFGLQYSGTMPLFFGFASLMLGVALLVTLLPSTRRLSALPRVTAASDGEFPQQAPPRTKDTP